MLLYDKLRNSSDDGSKLSGRDSMEFEDAFLQFAQYNVRSHTNTKVAPLNVQQRQVGRKRSRRHAPKRVHRDVSVHCQGEEEAVQC